MASTVIIAKLDRLKTAKRQLEGLFSDLLSRLRPDPAYMRLFNAIVLDVWRERQGEASRLRAAMERVVREKRERLDRVDDAFLHERSIDCETYERQRDQFREQLATAEAELGDAVVEQLDVEGVLAFADHVLTNAARLWLELALDQKQQLQRVLFPEGLRFDGEKFGTAVTCLAFKTLDGNSKPKSGMASPTGHAASGCFGPFQNPKNANKSKSGVRVIEGAIPMHIYRPRDPARTRKVA